MFYPIKFKPLFKDYLWGGRNLSSLGKALPETGIVAESWEIADHPDGKSIIANGMFADRSFSSVLSEYPREIIGTQTDSSEYTCFPILIKFLDAEENLSVQVHPDDDYSFINENGEKGKNEMWYILSAKPGARLICGIKSGVSRGIFAESIKNGTVCDMLGYIEVKPGDFINIPAGTAHAIGAGIVLVEIQQNSNATYRVYDYDRIDKNGMKRELHIKKALDVINFNGSFNNKLQKANKQKISDSCDSSLLVSTKYYAVEKIELSGTLTQTADGRCFYIYTFISGKAVILTNDNTTTVIQGETVLIPACMGKYTIKGHCIALKTYVPDS